MVFSISFVPIFDALFRHCFRAAGLRPAAAILDADTTIHYWAPPSAAGDDPAKPPLLLIHGFGPGSTWQWSDQVAPLARHFHVVVPDLLSFGRSTATSPRGISEATQAAAMARLVAHLGLSGRRIAVVGTSYGGFVAYHLARSLGPERVGPIVIASSDLLKTPADDQAFAERAGIAGSAAEDVMLPTEAKAMRRLVGLAMYRPPRFVPDFLLRDFIRNLYNEKREEKVELIKAVTIGTKDFQLTPLEQEVLIIWGEHDRVFPLEKAYAMKSCLGGNNVKLEIIKSTAHMPQAEDPVAFNKVMLNFLLGVGDAPKDNTIQDSQ